MVGADLDNILGLIKKTYSKSFDIDIGDLHFEVEPLTSVEDVKVLEACKEVEGAQYLEALKRHTLAFGIKKINDMDLRSDDVEYEDGEGVKALKSKYLFMVDYITKFPSALVESLFNAFINMQNIVETKIKKEIKYEHFSLSEQPEEEVPEKFRKLSETDVPSSDLTEVEELNKKVAEEIDNEGKKLSQVELPNEKE